MCIESVVGAGRPFDRERCEKGKNCVEDTGVSEREPVRRQNGLTSGVSFIHDAPLFERGAVGRIDPRPPGPCRSPLVERRRQIPEGRPSVGQAAQQF